MWLLIFIAFLLLGGFLLLSALRYGIPDMVSDIYYQLQSTTGSEVIGGKRRRNFGWVFSVVIVSVAALLMVGILDMGQGIQCLAFLGCGGLAFVGLAPNYLQRDQYMMHKGGATVAAVGCVGWCLSVCWWPTFIVLFAYALYLLAIDFFKVANGFWYISKDVRFHPWYWAEVAAFADVFLTYWTIIV